MFLFSFVFLPSLVLLLLFCSILSALNTVRDDDDDDDDNLQNDFFDLGKVDVDCELLLLNADKLDAVVIDGEQRLDAVRPDATVVREDLGAAVQRELRHYRQVLSHRICRRLALAVPLSSTAETHEFVRIYYLYLLFVFFTVLCDSGSK